MAPLDRPLELEPEVGWHGARPVDDAAGPTDPDDDDAGEIEPGVVQPYPPTDRTEFSAVFWKLVGQPVPNT